MPNILATLRDFFVTDSNYSQLVLAWGAEGVPEAVDPQPILLRAFYLSSSELETRMEAASLALSVPVPDSLLCALPAYDGPHVRIARLFKHGGTTANTPHRDMTGVQRTVSMNRYFAVGSGGFAWENDASQRRPGYFVTGDAGRRSLWHVDRIDQDAFRGPVFTLRPVELTADFPALDLSSISDALRRAEVTGQYEELQRCVVNGAFRGVVSRAKDIAEGLLSLAAGIPPNKNFSETLEKVLPLIESRQVPIQRLTYHLCQKLRYLHQRTHPDRAVQSGRPITPELALTAVQDVIEILHDLGYTKS